MKRKQIVDLVVAGFLIVAGSIILFLPMFKSINVKYVFIGILTFYGVMNLLQFMLTSKEKDYEGLFTMCASILTLILVAFIDVDRKPINLALILFFWIMMMSLIKLKKADYYHDKHKDVWILRIVMLVIFILSGLLAVIDLYYSSDVQILVLGFFYFIHGVLEIMDPLVNYLIKKH